jgi:peptidoglycan hydrolase CwlO-like protein
VLRLLPSDCGRVAKFRRPTRPLVSVALAFSLLVALLTLSGPLAGPAGAQGSSDPRAERDKVRAQRAELAVQVDALKADNAEVDAALAALDQNLRGKQAAFADADRAATEAEAAAADARDAEARKQVEIDELRGRIAEFAVDAYVNPPGNDLLDSFRADNAGDAVQKRTLLDLRSGNNTDILDQLRAAERELREARELAEQAQEQAIERRAAAQSQLGEVEAARSQQAQFAVQVQQRLDARLGEAAALADTDKELSNQISRSEAELAARLARMATAQAASTPTSGGGGPPGGSIGGPPIAVPGPIALANVRGIVVAASIAGQTEAMLAAAAADGITLSGSGYRDINRQIELRRQNCGTSEYAIYQMPAEQCRPATARPGASKHERGLAIDFTEGGRTLTTRSAGYRWLVGNASRFGFGPLAGEPWHWSVGGG